ncbi:MAG: alpha,alpha-trehalose-phosphate synthase (UDP-forming) [Sphingomonadaceae bacterium]
MSRLIVVSNRVAAPRPDTTGSQGGLAVALASALRQSRGVWFGWSGQEVERFTGQIHLQRHAGVTTATVDLEPRDLEEYYNGYANRTLWPLFHYRIDLTEYDRQFDAGYARVNQRFAETLTPILEPDDLIWVHDYHLIPLARELRLRGVRNRIGFFLHTSWPPVRLLTTLPNHRDLVAALFEHDLVGFQTREWLETFREYVTREGGGEILPDGQLRAFGRTIAVGAFPIGIDAQAFRRSAASPEARAMARRMKESIAGRAMIVGVDRLDYSKGLQERFSGYERFLADNPEWLNRVFLLQIAPPSRDSIGSYQEIRDTLDQLSGRINGAFAEVDWVPLRYVNRGYNRRELAGIYRTARVGLVTPLRDGMNLVAKEFVAAQDAKDPGVLILSKFAGAALQLRDALLINPYSLEEIADSIRQGLAMDRDERIRRWEPMFENVMHEDVTHWRKTFVEALSAARG